MKRYSKLDNNVPMAFLKFYIYVRMPACVLYFIADCAMNGITGLVFFAWRVIEVLTLVCACVGLAKRKYWGYVMNKAFLIAEIVASVLLILICIVEMEEIADISSLIAIVIVSIPMFIYFEKRKYLFEGAPCEQEQTVRNDLPTVNGSLILDTVYFPFVCPHCRNTVKGKYKAYEGVETLPNLNITCPECNNVTTIKVLLPQVKAVVPKRENKMKQKLDCLRKKIKPVHIIIALLSALTIASITVAIVAVSNSSSYAASSSPSTSTAKYIGNSSSKKLHKTSCDNLPNVGNRVGFSSRDKAISKGYVPCKICNP